MKIALPSLLLLTATMLSSAPALAKPPALSIETVIRDMHQPNEAIPLHPTFDWQRHPHIMQYAPKGHMLPDWWKGARPEWCYTFLSWYTAYEAGGPDGKEAGANRATNTRVQVRNLRAYIMWEDGRWTRVDDTGSPRVDLWSYPFKRAGRSSRAREERERGNSVKPVYPDFHHGYGTTYALDNPWDVRAVFVAMDFRLVIDDPDGPDDRDKARYVVNVGADYYPGRGRGWGLDYAPGVGSGRYLLATKSWRTATLLVPNKDHGVSFQRLRERPPPLAVARAR